MIDTSRPGTGAQLQVRDLSVEFEHRHGRRQVVDHVSFNVRHGECFGLVGESGSGKSMTVLALLGLLGGRGRAAHVSGAVTFEELDLLRLDRRQLSEIRGNRIGMVFQDPDSSLDPSYTVGEQVAETIRRHRQVSRKEARRIAIEKLRLVEIPGAERRYGAYPHEFSGGMRQRVLIAAALACDPSLLIADEPTTALDVTVQAQVIELLRRLADDLHMSMIFITHDLGVLAAVADRVGVMFAGELVEEALATDLFERPKHPYTESLLRSAPELLDLTDQRELRVSASRPAREGCRYALACDYVREACTQHRVALSGRPDTYEHRVRCIRSADLELRSADALWTVSERSTPAGAAGET